MKRYERTWMLCRILKNEVKMKVIRISRSPPKFRNTAYAVQYVRGFMDKEGFKHIITLTNRKINPCIDCRKCTETRVCIYDDAMPEILKQCAGVRAC